MPEIMTAPKKEQPVMAIESGRQINWNRIYQFAEVATAGSIKLAAERLGLSPSTLSEHISQLESELSVRLFVREHRRLRLTNEGARLALHARQMFEAGKRLIDIVSPLALGAYPVSVGLVPCPSLQIAYGVTADYVKRFGPLDMKIVHTAAEQLEDGLLRAQFDFGFSNQLPTHKGLRAHLVASPSFGFFVAQKLASRGFEELIRAIPLLLCESDPSARNLTEQLLVDFDLEPSTVIKADYPGLLVELCSRGLGIGVFSDEQVACLKIDSLRSLQMPGGARRLRDNLYVVWARDGENSAAIQQLKKLLGLGAKWFEVN
jgi:DNA-binding transcriptional LysR family regulator